MYVYICKINCIYNTNVYDIYYHNINSLSQYN